MKSVIFAVFALLVCSAFAFAFGPKSVDSTNVKGEFVLSNPAGSTCVDMPIGRAGSVTVSTPASGAGSALYLTWQTFVKSSGVAVAVKRSFNSNTAYMVSTGKTDAIHPNTTTSKFTNYSTGAVNTLCYDKNS